MGYVMKEILDNSAWKKTFKLIEEKYGKTLQFRALKLLSDQKKSAYLQGDDFVIPLSLKDQDLGNVIVTRGSFLSDDQKNEIVDLIRFLVEPQVYTLHLKTTEQNILSQKKNDAREKSKVVQLFENYNVYQPPAIKKLLSQVIHLKSHTVQSRNKVAFKIHEMSQRNLFVRFHDIINSSATVEDLLTLSDTTVFIEDIEALTNSELQLLESFLGLITKDNLDSTPIILVGSSLPLATLESKNWNMRLKNDLMGFYFDIDRVPLAQQTSHEILDLLFFEINNEPMA